jgi:hypothetical protein
VLSVKRIINGVNEKNNFNGVNYYFFSLAQNKEAVA